jgi:hypothetical protein
MNKIVIYMIGSLKNPKIPEIAKEIRGLGKELSVEIEAFDDWFSPGPEADDFWRNFEKVRGSTYKQALRNYAGKHIFEFDKFHIDRADVGILIMPAGKSGHMELGYLMGRCKTCFVFFEEEPERWDVMYQFAMENDGDVCFSKEELFEGLRKLFAKLAIRTIDKYEQIASTMNWHNRCARATLGDMREVTAEDVRRMYEG